MNVTVISIILSIILLTFSLMAIYIILVDKFIDKPYYEKLKKLNEEPPRIFKISKIKKGNTVIPAWEITDEFLIIRYWKTEANGIIEYQIPLKYLRKED